MMTMRQSINANRATIALQPRASSVYAVEKRINRLLLLLALTRTTYNVEER